MEGVNDVLVEEVDIIEEGGGGGGGIYRIRGDDNEGVVTS